MKLFHFLDDLLEVRPDLRNWLAANFHRAIRRLAQHDIYLPKSGILVQVIFPELRSPAFLALDGRASDSLGCGSQIG